MSRSRVLHILSTKSPGALAPRDHGDVACYSATPLFPLPSPIPHIVNAKETRGQVGMQRRPMSDSQYTNIESRYNYFCTE